MVASIFASQQPSFRQTLDPATVALIARMSVQPDAARTTLINNLIVGLKNASLWNKLAVFYMMAAHDAQAGRLNWKSSSYNLSAVSSPTFTTDRGYTTDGASSYLDTGYSLFADSGALQDSTSLGIYINAGADVLDTSYAIGALLGGSGTFISPMYSVNAIRARVNDNASNNYSGLSISTRYGYSVVSRTGTNTTYAYKNAIQSGLNTALSTSKTNVSVWIGAVNNNGSLFGPSNNRFAHAFIGNGLSAAEVSSLNTLVLTYLTAIGANV